jgi:molybdate transport system regulatory protein
MRRRHDRLVIEVPPLRAALQLGEGLDGAVFALLAALHDTSSLHQAARRTGYSYKGAWLILDAAANSVRYPLVQTATGGRDVGGTRLTAEGEALLAIWLELQQRQQAFLAVQAAWLTQNPLLEKLLGNPIVKSSARNQLHGQIAKISADGQFTHAVIELAHGLRIDAVWMTGDQPAPKLGEQVVALVKASELILLQSDVRGSLLGTNHIPCSVVRMTGGAVNTLIGLVSPQGQTLAASITNEASEALGLAIGDSVIAAFSPMAVMVMATV